MTTLQIPINVSACNSLCDDLGKKRSCFGLKFLQPINWVSLSRRKIGTFHENGFNFTAFARRMSLFGDERERGGLFLREERRRSKRVVLVRVNQGFGFNGGGGGRDNSNTARILGNLALAIGLTYLSMTGQLGWVLDAIVSIWVSFSPFFCIKNIWVFLLFIHESLSLSWFLWAGGHVKSSTLNLFN